MRPFAGDQPHDVQQPRARRQNFLRRRALNRLEPRRDRREPVLARIRRRGRNPA